jgi:hypothetical protein
VIHDRDSIFSKRLDKAVTDLDGRVFELPCGYPRRAPTPELIANGIYSADLYQKQLLEEELDAI